MVQRRRHQRSNGSSSGSETTDAPFDVATEVESGPGYETDMTNPVLPRGRSRGGGRGDDSKGPVLEDTDEGTDGHSTPRREGRGGLV